MVPKVVGSTPTVHPQPKVARLVVCEDRESFFVPNFQGGGWCGEGVFELVSEGVQDTRGAVENSAAKEYW